MVLVIGKGEGTKSDIQKVLNATAQKKTLVVVERHGFEDKVGLTFYIANNRLRLDLNLQLAERLGITVSQQLKSLPSVRLR